MDFHERRIRRTTAAAQGAVGQAMIIAAAIASQLFEWFPLDIAVAVWSLAIVALAYSMGARAYDAGYQDAADEAAAGDGADEPLVALTRGGGR